MPQTRRIVKNSSYLLVAQVPIQAANAVYVLVLAQFLGVEDFGRFATLWALLALFGAVIEQGLARSLTRDLASQAIRFADGVANGLILATGLGLLCVAVFVGAGWALSVILGNTPDMLVLAVVAGSSLVPRALWMTISAVFNARQQIGISAALSMLASLANVALGIGLLLLGLGLAGVMLAIAVAQLVPLVLAVMVLPRSGALAGYAIARADLMRLARSALPFSVRALLGIVYFRADLLLISALIGFTAAGTYQAAYKVFELAIVLPGAANAAAYPVLSAYFASDRARAARAFERLNGGMMLVGLPLAALLYGFAAPLVELLYGAAYREAAPILAVLAGAVLLSYLNAAPITLLSASPWQAALTIVTASGLAVNLAANAVLIPGLAGYGAAIAMIASEAAQFLLLIFLAAWLTRGARAFLGAPELLMALGLAVAAGLAYALPNLVDVTVDPVLLVALPGLCLYLAGAALYLRRLFAERAFAAVSGVWETAVSGVKPGARR